VWKYHGDVTVREIIKDLKVLDMCLQPVKKSYLYSASKDVGDVQECGNYKDMKFMSSTTEV